MNGGPFAAQVKSCIAERALYSIQASSDDRLLADLGRADDSSETTASASAYDPCAISAS